MFESFYCKKLMFIYYNNKKTVIIEKQRIEDIC